MRTCMLAVILIALPLAAQTTKKPAPKKKQPAKVTSMTGCVDQREEGFFLTDDKELKPIAKLEGDDPERKSFAKYLGNKVTVTGTVSSAAGLPSIQVREVKVISEICAPH